MTGEQLTVSLFFWGSAVVIGLDALKSDSWRRVALWLLTCSFVAGGFLVKPLWETFPDVSTWLTGLVYSPVAWFGLAVVAYLGLRAPLRIEGENSIPPQQPSESTVTAAEPPKGLSGAERERQSEARIKLEAFLKDDVLAFVQQGRSTVCEYKTIIPKEGGQGYYLAVDGFRRSVVPFGESFEQMKRSYRTEFKRDHFDVESVRDQIFGVGEPVAQLLRFVDENILNSNNPSLYQHPAAESSRALTVLENSASTLVTQIERKRLDDG